MPGGRGAEGGYATRPAQFETQPPGPAASGSAARAVFDALSAKGPPTLGALTAVLQSEGLCRDDPRLSAVFEREDADTALDAEALGALPWETLFLARRALEGGLAAADFPNFRRRIGGLFDVAADIHDGEVAAYIPELADADPDAFALGACTIDGQRFSRGRRDGDASLRFCLQSVSKPVTYALALELLGERLVHAYVGREPSGQSFNEITLDRRRRPHNPMINAGAIMTSALIRPTRPVDERFDLVRRVWRSASAGREPGFNARVCASERATADRNYALGYFMREHGGFPEEADLHEALDLYFRCCAIETDVESLAIAAATLANGGVCPVTERRVFGRRTVRHVLSLMLSCGMYDFSGEFAFTVGLPAKSGVSGAMIIVVPGVAGFALYSPPLGPQGNPERGVEFARRAVEAFPWHVYALVAGADAEDPRQAGQGEALP